MGRPTDHLKRLIRGELPLLVVFWLWFIGGGVIAGMVVGVWERAMYWDDIRGAWETGVYVGLVGLRFAFIAATAVFVWRAAARYTGRQVWVITAKALAILSVIGNAQLSVQMVQFVN